MTLSNDPIALITEATRWLAAHPDAPLAERVAMATVIACGGDPEGECTFAEVAMYAGSDVTPSEAVQALYTLRERGEVTHD